MPKTVTDVLRLLELRLGDETERHIEVLSEHQLHVDYGEPDQVFTITVDRI